MTIEPTDEVRRLQARVAMLEDAIKRANIWIGIGISSIEPQHRDAFYKDCAMFREALAADPSAWLRDHDAQVRDAAWRKGAEAAAKAFEDKPWARARYDEGIEWEGNMGLSAYSPYKHSLACAAAIRKLVPDPPAPGVQG